MGNSLTIITRSKGGGGGVGENIWLSMQRKNMFHAQKHHSVIKKKLNKYKVIMVSLWDRSPSIQCK